MTDLSIVILPYKSKEHLKVLLPSIFGSEGVGFGVVAPFMGPDGLGSNKSGNYTAEVIIVDNDSRDGTVEWLPTTNYPLLTIANSNTGYAAGNNLGIKKASGKYVLLLNPDTKLEPNTLKGMLDFMEEHQEVGISGCKCIKADGKLDLACRRRFPHPWYSFKRLFLLDTKDYNYSNMDENLSMEVDSVVGAFMLIRKSVMEKIGLLDERFFMYAEDLDYCWRCKEAGFKVWYYPLVLCHHYKGESSKKIAFKALKWFHDSMWIFYKKHYARKYWFVLNWAVWLGIYVRMLALIFINLFKDEPEVSK